MTPPNRAMRSGVMARRRPASRLTAEIAADVLPAYLGHGAPAAGFTLTVTLTGTTWTVSSATACST